LTHLDLDIPKRFPTIYQRVLSAGIDMGKDLIPVAPAAHYFMGGIQTDTYGLTSVKNLYAAGETACLGLHGANRLASNSLLDGLVFGHRAAEHALLSSYSSPEKLPLLPHLSIHTDSTVMSKALIAKQDIRQTMWDEVGIVRNETSLLKALASFKEHDWLLQEKTWNPALREIQGLHELAKIITEFALNRTESRGGHYREDFPHAQNPAWQHHLTISPCRTAS
jgi:L-aspartate oxidase